MRISLAVPIAAILYVSVMALVQLRAGSGNRQKETVASEA